jgi:cell division septum initiation protein DivIVA
MRPSYDQLLAENAELKAQIQSLKDRIAALEDQINQNSKNSSKPSSTERKPSSAPQSRCVVSRNARVESLPLSQLAAYIRQQHPSYLNAFRLE